jgi:glycolate oxidase FAD binding subunit
MNRLAGAPPRPPATGTIEAASTAEVQHAVRSAAARGATLRIAGSGTWLRAGRPVSAAMTLSIRSLSGIVEYVPGDLTITAWAGTTLAELDRVTAEHGQWIALDPPGSRSGTLGATVATASAGPLATSFGTPRDVVLGVQAVTGDGDIIHGGARVVKHVAGFDLVRLMTGAWGTLGVVTMLTLRLRARAPVDATFAVAPGAASLREWFPAYRAASVAPLAAELLHDATAASLGLEPQPLVLVRVSGNDEAIAAQEQALRDLGALRQVSSDIWQTLAALDPAAPAAALRVSQRPGHVADVWEHATALAQGVAGARVQATLDRGVARVVLPGIASADLLARLDRPGPVACTRVFETLPAELWGRLVPSAAASVLSRRIRRAFDPESRLNPGLLGEPNE